MLAQTLVLDGVVTVAVRCQLALGRKPLHQQLRSQTATRKRRLLIPSDKTKGVREYVQTEFAGRTFVRSMHTQPTQPPHARTHAQHTRLYPLPHTQPH